MGVCQGPKGGRGLFPADWALGSLLQCRLSVLRSPEGPMGDGVQTPPKQLHPVMLSWRWGVLATPHGMPGEITGGGSPGPVA